MNEASPNEQSAAAGQVATVIDQSACYAAVGIANLVNVLDLDRVVLAGEIADDLWEAADGVFRKRLERYVDDYAFRRPPDNPYVPAAEATLQGWQGAALLFRDPTYAVLVGPQT